MYNSFRNIISSALVLSLFVSGCYKEADVENTAAVDMAGEWFVEYFADDDPTTSLVGHNVMLTYNTADNSTSQLWIEEHFWPFKVKANIDYASKAFTETTSAENLEHPGSFIRILEGKVLKDAGKSQSGNVVDSIFMRVEFLDEDPGVIYQIRGHMKTGFFEDEY